MVKAGGKWLQVRMWQGSGRAQGGAKQDVRYRLCTLKYQSRSLPRRVARSTSESIAKSIAGCAERPLFVTEANNSSLEAPGNVLEGPVESSWTILMDTVHFSTRNSDGP